ncbi:MAG TPA: hypothetical protein PKC18_15560, partial [Lacipirellulaceae bacterium]|nr:hypothetical protein [Lacipirellulaceae bacterium]
QTHPLEIWFVSTAFGVCCASLFLGMKAAADEHASGTVRFLQALPVSMTAPATVKLVLAAATVVVPVLVLAAAASFIEGRTDDAWLRTLYLAPAQSAAWGLPQRVLGLAMCAAAGAVSLLIWMAAAGVNRSDEVRAAAVGIAAIVGWYCLHAVAYYALGVTDARNTVNTTVIWLGPGGPGIGSFGQDGRSPPAGPVAWPGSPRPFLAAAAASHRLLVAWYLTRYARQAPTRHSHGEPQATRRVAAAPDVWPGRPRRSPLTAILWQQTRQSAPLAAIGAATIAGFAAWWTSTSNLYARRDFQEGWVEMTIQFTMMIGVLVAVVAGVGVFLDDLKPGIHGFWRSRPVDLRQWFAVKVLGGLLVTLGILALPAAGALAMAPAHAWVWQDLPFGIYLLATGIGGAFLAGVLAMLLLRRPIFAGLGGLAGFGATSGVLFGLCDWLAIAERSVGATFVTLSALLLAAGAAWTALKHDWGWKT